MESSGEVGKVNISEATYVLVKNAVMADDNTQHATRQPATRPAFTFTPRGKVQAKGKGEMEMYFVQSTWTAHMTSNTSRMRKPFISIVCGALLFCTGVHAQNKALIDSLRAVLNGPLPDTTRIVVLYDLSWELADAGDHYRQAKGSGAARMALAIRTGPVNARANAFNILGEIAQRLDDYPKHDVVSPNAFRLKPRDREGTQRGRCVEQYGQRSARKATWPAP
ncbi:MAG: hypothetical protein IPJ85_10245 [Flavobacteriales bacterium]|nr:hypothetical protein [Flavobacteriales bacterium]